DLDVGLNEFNLQAISPFGGDVITNIRGLVSGNANIVGDYRSPDITGRLDLFDAGMKVPYLNIDFDFKNESRILLSKNRFTIPKTEIIDTKYKTNASLSGY